MAKGADIVIIGGGIIGSSLAYWLHRQGSAKIILLEACLQLAGPPSASFASAGIIGPAGTPETPPPLLALMERSQQLYPALIEELQPYPTGYTTLNELRLALNGSEVRGLQKRQRWYVESGYVPEAVWLTPQEVGQVEPLAGPNAGAIQYPGAIVDPPALTRALAQAAIERGATIRLASPVAKLLVEGGRVAGVRLAEGAVIRAEKVVLAAGAWGGRWLAAQLAGLGLPNSFDFAGLVGPVRGQMLAIRPPSGQPNLRHLLTIGPGYAMPRPDGTVAYGATVEPEAGFAAEVTPAGLLELGRLVHKLTPALENALVTATWAGLRPGSRLDRPLLGPLAQLPGLWLALGHYRNGVLLAPASAELLSTTLLTGDTAPLTPFAPPQ